ncbi:hypothetical protein DNTS_015951 [Danionella cerebrum]|uniref:Epoxide hydrolase n=1 Tax=Danionella cerebrum TaxID=2873325 RepID=A0A553R1U7_9TELE|nr:hypothetical protein DNTS_015951 [Danionella translucida]
MGLQDAVLQTVESIKGSFVTLDRSKLQLFALSSFGAGALLCYLKCMKTIKTIPTGDGWWGKGERLMTEDNSIRRFVVKTSAEEIEDLHRRIDQTRFTDPLEDSRFNYGFNSAYLRTVVSYWRHQFNWEKQVDVINQYPHFKTKIEGIDVHFVHARPTQKPGQTVLPLMMVHGWPGSFYEFYGILPLLTKTDEDVVFEVICPSIPGYGYSEAPHKKGFNTLEAARIFLKLMERLGFREFYVQGGDWGAFITSNMAQMKPECVRGLHLNMVIARTDSTPQLLSLVIGRYLPFLVGFTKEDVRRLYPYMEKNVFDIMRETGYLHIQATKPDTAGCGLNDSPVGLAAYILEKFSSWTNLENRDLVDGGLEKKFNLDDLLTNVMIYWTTCSIIPSMRFYKENIKKDIKTRVDRVTKIYVPTGLAAFPDELLHCPRAWASSRFTDVRSFSYMSRGGHFAAFEEPHLLAQDIIQFAKKVERKAH